MPCRNVYITKGQRFRIRLCVYPYSAWGFCSLLVLLYRAIPEPLIAGRATCTALTLSFYYPPLNAKEESPVAQGIILWINYLAWNKLSRLLLGIAAFFCISTVSFAQDIKMPQEFFGIGRFISWNLNYNPDKISGAFQAQDAGGSPLCMDQCAPTPAVWPQNASPESIKCFKDRIRPPMRSIYEPVSGCVGLSRPIPDSRQLRELTTDAGIQSQSEVNVESI